MKSRVNSIDAVQARRWARRLSAQVRKVLSTHPHANADNIRHTLILLELPPLERLQRSLIRGRAKDKLTIPVLQDALAVTRTAKRRLKHK